MSDKINSRKFQETVEEIARAFRQKIELEVEAFAADPQARKQRIAKVMDPLTGYQFFAETYFPHYLIKEPSKLHELLYEDLPAMVENPKGVKELLIAPRGSAKSTHVSLIFPLWCIICGVKHYIALIMDAFEQAAIMVEALKAELEVNPRLAYDFPDIMGQGRVWREGNIVTRSNVRVEGFGTGKKIRGRRHGPYRPDLAILDDVENDENVASPEQRDKLEKWISKAVLELGPTDGSMDVLYAGTVLHFDAVIVRFAKKPGWKVVRYQAIIQWPDRMDLWEEWEETYLNEGETQSDQFYRKNKKAMDVGCILNWPGNHTLLYLMKKRAGEHSAFESEYQNKPISDGNPFQKITWWVQRRPDLIHFGAIDPSLGKKGKGRDPSAIIIGGVDRLAGEMDVLEASIRRRLPDIIISDAIALQREYNCLLWFVEAVQFQEFLRTSLMREAAKSQTPLSAIPVIPFADKDLRIERLQPPVASGLIRLHMAQTTLIDQLQQWPAADHDDGPDCLEMLWHEAIQRTNGFKGNVLLGSEGGSDQRLEGYR